MNLRCSFTPGVPGLPRLRWVAGISLLAALTACGGSDNNNNMAQGGGNTPMQAGSVPASAFASTSAFIAYLAALAPDDTGEPLAVDGTPPVSDNTEPVPV